MSPTTAARRSRTTPRAATTACFCGSGSPWPTTGHYRPVTRSCGATSRPASRAAGSSRSRCRRSVVDRRLHHRAKLVAQEARVLGVRLHHVDADELFLGIDPEGRAGGARPAVFADRAHQGGIAAELGVDLEAQPEAEAVGTAGPVADVVGGHE